MRFCQTDGTALVEKVEEKPPEPVDPYKTMVASKADIAAAIPPLASSQPPGAHERGRAALWHRLSKVHRLLRGGAVRDDKTAAG